MVKGNPEGEMYIILWFIPFVFCLEVYIDGALCLGLGIVFLTIATSCLHLALRGRKRRAIREVVRLGEGVAIDRVVVYAQR